MSRTARSILLTLVVALLVACGPAPVSQTPTASNPTRTPDPLSAYPSGRATVSGVVLMTQDTLIDTADGIALRAVYRTTDFTPAPAVILLHQNGGRKEDFGALTQALQQNGFIVLAVDLRGHGQTGGTVDWVKTQADIPVLVAWLSRQESVDAERIGIIGASVGANLALNTAAQDARVRAAVLLSPGANYMDIATLPAATKFGGPLFFIASSEDTDPAQTVPQLVEAHQGVEDTLMLTGAGHATAMLTAQPDLAQTIIAWLHKNL